MSRHVYILFTEIFVNALLDGPADSAVIARKVVCKTKSAVDETVNPVAVDTSCPD